LIARVGADDDTIEIFRTHFNSILKLPVFSIKQPSSASCIFLDISTRIAIPSLRWTAKTKGESPNTAYSKSLFIPRQSSPPSSKRMGSIPGDTLDSFWRWRGDEMKKNAFRRDPRSQLELGDIARLELDARKVYSERPFFARASQEIPTSAGRIPSLLPTMPTKTEEPAFSEKETVLKGNISSSPSKARLNRVGGEELNLSTVFLTLDPLADCRPSAPTDPSHQILKIEQRKSETSPDVLTPYHRVHHRGWKKNCDEWVPQSRVLKFTDDNQKRSNSLPSFKLDMSETLKELLRRESIKVTFRSKVASGTMRRSGGGGGGSKGRVTRSRRSYAPTSPSLTPVR
ncbi:hypothetical protein BDK51DRAFT_31029, partial [Blyttiomyces helicus]